ncbi:MAG: GatB/YqeY domain-containing protein [bacterium]
MFNKLNSDLQKAMKEKNADRLEVLRMVKSKILYVNARGDLPEAEIIKIVNKYAKDLKEAIVETEKVGRTEAVDKLKKELTIVQEYLPKELSDDEIKGVVEKAIKDLGATSKKEMGKVMKEITAANPGIDGKKVSAIVQSILQ